MTLNELSYNVLNKLSGGRSTHNSYISLDQVKFNINYYRSLLIHRDIRRSQNTEYFEQELCPVELTRVTSTNNSNIHTILKSVERLPDIVRFNYEFPFYVKSKLLDIEYPIESMHRAIFQKYNRYTDKEPRAYLRNGYLYLTRDLYGEFIHNELEEEPDQINDLCVRGIFENPTQVQIFNGVDPLDADDKPYPVSGDMAQRISESLINGDFQLILRTPADITHDNLPPSPKGTQG